jgi:bifunctional non-homologous end joining protein LigD
VFAAPEAAGLEGIVSKRADSRYRSGSTRDWFKIKAFEEAEFELLGVKRVRGKPPIAMLARGGRHVGDAFITLPSEIRERLWRRVEQHAAPPPKANSQTGRGQRRMGATGVIIGRVRFLKGGQSLRHATLKDWREEDA